MPIDFYRADTELKALRRRHEQEIADFIKSCPHVELTNWQKWAWTADGKFQWWGRYCERCEAMVDEKSVRSQANRE